jgi:hypothetical protein
VGLKGPVAKTIWLTVNRQSQSNSDSDWGRENIRGLNLAVVKPTTVQVTKLPLKHKISNIGMTCSVKPILTEDLCIVQKEEVLNNKLYVWKVHLTKG